jgi:hypothetical protein
MKKIFYSLPLIALALLFACEHSQTESNDADLLSEEEDFVAAAPRTDLLRISDEDNTLMATIQVGEEQQVEITFGEAKLLGKVKSSEKKKYSDHTDFTLMEVKTKSPSSFKLNTHEGQLLWKVKLQADKVKISRYEDGSDPYELKKDKEGKIKLIYKEQELGSASPNAQGNKIQMKQGKEEVFSVQSGQNSFAFALMLAAEIPLEEKYVLMAELLARGL